MQDKLNIGILLPGHLRYWTDCKSNFLENLYDTNHNIDVYVDTYSSVFRSDYEMYGEKYKRIILSDAEIEELFIDMNVVRFNVDSDDTKYKQIPKLKKCYQMLVDNKKNYDLIVRYRFDMMLEKKIDYVKIYEECIKNPKLIFIGKGGMDGLLNDMFAICISKTFDIYMNRFKFSDYSNTEGMEHGSLKQIMIDHNIVYNMDTQILLKRPDDKIYRMGT
jgi:hypothetical protein